MIPYQVTGNEYLSLPTIRETDGAAEGVAFLSMGLKGLVELRGEEGLVRPYLAVNGARCALTPVWRRDQYWIHGWEAREGDLTFRCAYLTPVGERAFAVRLEAENGSDLPADLALGVEGRWDRTLHEINETAELTLGKR